MFRKMIWVLFLKFECYSKGRENLGNTNWCVFWCVIQAVSVNDAFRHSKVGQLMDKWVHMIQAKMLVDIGYMKIWRIIERLWLPG